jgi:uncharacterized protein YndB with AHSA1/START domain
MAKINITAEPGKQVIIIRHIFDAPRELVWKAMTDPDLIPRWWGPKMLATIVDQLDLRRGGIWRFIQRGPEGDDYVFHGVYHDIVQPERVVQTFEFEGMPGHVSLQTTIFDEHDGRTEATQTSVFQSIEDRDGMLNSGMEKGATESHDRLAELLKEIK